MPAYTFRFSQQAGHPTRDSRQQTSRVKSHKHSRSLQSFIAEINEILSEQRLADVRIDEKPISDSEAAAIALTLSETRMRYEALEVLEQCHDPQAITALNQAANDQNPLLAMYAARELARKGEPLQLAPFIRCIDEIVMWVPDEAIESLVELHDIRATGVLLTALSHPRLDIRLQAGHALIALTGMDFGWDIEMWEQWWQERDK